jgi:hypothetical protein
VSREPLDRRDLLRELATTETQCTARSKRTGERCRLPSALGSNVCRSHGAAAPQTRAKAKRRLDQASDVLVQRLLSFALDGDAPDNVALAAIRDALDRAGLGAKQAVEVGVELQPYEQVLNDIVGIAHITRAESRERQSFPATGEPRDAEASAQREILDAELVPEAIESRPRLARASVPTQLAAGGHESESAAGEGWVAPPPVHVSYDQAPAVMRAARLQIKPQQRRIRRPPRPR